ncbi:MAG: tetratricopeptide repeat protein, partial [Candidatus Thermoplasmatota archaeon]
MTYLTKTLKFNSLWVLNVPLLFSLSGHTSLSAQARERNELGVKPNREFVLYSIADSARRMLENGKTVEVQNICNNAIDTFYRGQDSKYFAYIFSDKASIYRRLGNYFLSNKCYLFSNNNASLFGEKVLIASNYNNIGTLFSLSHRFEEAKKLFWFLVNDTSGVTNDLIITSALMNLADIANQENDLSRGGALFYQLANNVNIDNVFIFERNFGRFLIKTNKKDSAYIHFKIALKES